MESLCIVMEFRNTLGRRMGALYDQDMTWQSCKGSHGQITAVRIMSTDGRIGHGFLI